MEDKSKKRKIAALIVGDSMIFEIEQQRLSIEEIIVKLWSFRGAKINDMCDYIKPLLKKNPIMSSYMLLPTTHQIVHQERSY